MIFLYCGCGEVLVITTTVGRIGDQLISFTPEPDIVTT